MHSDLFQYSQPKSTRNVAFHIARSGFLFMHMAIILSLSMFHSWSFRVHMNQLDGIFILDTDVVTDGLGRTDSFHPASASMFVAIDNAIDQSLLQYSYS